MPGEAISDGSVVNTYFLNVVAVLSLLSWEYMDLILTFYPRLRPVRMFYLFFMEAEQGLYGEKEPHVYILKKKKSK